MKLRKLLFPVSLLSSTAAAVGQSTDLSVFQTVDKPSPLVGTNVVFTVQASNNSVDNASGVTVADLLPSGYQFVSAAPDAGSYNQVTGVWTIGALLAGEIYHMDVTAKVLPTGIYQNVATVAGNEVDPDSANNSWMASTTPTMNIYWDGGTANIDPLATPPDGFSAGGTGTWDTILKNWDAGGAETDYMAWSNTAGYTANLGGAAGTVTLGSAVSAGKLVISGAYTVATGPSSNTLTLTGTGTTLSGNNTITISGSGALTLGSSQTWANTANTMTISAPVTTGANLLTLNTGNNNIDVTGVISGSGGLTVNSTVTSGTTASNSGTATLNNSNDYTGTTTVNGWIWLNSGGLSSGGLSPFGNGTSDLVFNSGGVRLTGIGTIDRGIQITGTSGISKVSGATTVNGVISGTGNLQISANFGVTAPVILNAANTFSGNCLSGPDGIVQLANVSAVGSATLRWADNNGRSKHDLSTSNLACVIGGLGNAAVSNVSNNLNLGTGLGGGGNGYVSFGANNQSNTYVGMLSGAAGFKKIGTGTQTLIGENSYTGNTLIAGGTLKLGKINGQTGVNVTTGTSGSNASRLTVPSSTNLYIGQAVSGSLVAPGSRITNINTATQVTLSSALATPATATTATFADILGSVATSPIIEVQSGAVLDVTAYPWTLLDTQTLKGEGTVTGAISVAGTVAPGSTTGTLTTGDVTFAATGTYACELNGASCDLLAAGNLMITAGAKITFAGTPTAPSYVIATYTGAAPSPFATDATLPAGYSVDYGTPGQIKLVTGGASPYDTWTSSKGLSGAGAAATADPDSDGLANAIEFVVGGEPNPANPGSNSSALLPTVASTATDLVFTFRRTDVSTTQPGAAIAAEYSTTLGAWTTAQNGVNGVTIAVTDDGFGAGVDKVDVSIPKGLAVGSKLFVRLSTSF